MQTILWRRTTRLDRSTITVITVGVIGGVAMVAALFFGILLVLQKRRERQKLRNLASGKNILQFPSRTNPALVPVPDSFSPPSKERPYAYQNVPPSSPPKPEPRTLDNVESAWFLNEGNGYAEPQRARTPPGRHTLPRKTSRQRLEAGQNPSIPADDSTTTRAPSRKTSRQNIAAEQDLSIPAESSQTTRAPSRKPSRQKIDAEPESFPAENSTTRAPSRKTSRQRIDADQNPSILAERSMTRPPATFLPQAASESMLDGPAWKSGSRPIPSSLSQPTQEPEHPPSPILFRQPAKPDPVTLLPRPRGSSLHGPRPTDIITAPPIPGVGRHVNSVSEDSRAVSRFSISPVARSFPSRLTFTGNSPPNRSASTRRTRRQGFGSLSGLMHLRSDATPDVPTQATDITAGQFR
jgi:hypothetical protein